MISLEVIIEPLKYLAIVVIIAEEKRYSITNNSLFLAFFQYYLLYIVYEYIIN